MPMIKADMAVTKPEAGVMQTRPATTPEHVPSTLGLPRKTHSSPAQVNPAEAAQKWVTMKALLAKGPAHPALPALKPNQPTHSIAAPMAVYVRLCGGMAVLP